MQRDVRRWLALAVFCLAAGGLYAVPLAAGRGVKNVSQADWQHWFNIVLAVHVDLSIFLWFLAMLIVGWRLIPAFSGTLQGVPLPFFQPTAQGLFALGAVLMAFSPFLGEGEGLRSNYIPILTNDAFFLSLALIACALSLSLLEALLSIPVLEMWRGAFQRDSESGIFAAYGAWGSAAMVAVSLVAFAVAPESIDPLIQGEAYFDMAFWAGGHVIQFAYVQMAMVVWLLLAQAAGLPVPGGRRLVAILFTINLAMMAYVPLPFISYPADSQPFRDAFTEWMIWGNGLSPALMLVILAYALFRHRRVVVWRSATLFCLVTSLILFFYGGVLAMMIEGQNVVIPAHYHGSIVGVTLAFMGLAYLLLPRIGLPCVDVWRLARLAPLLLCVGQIIHVSALAWSGGYGVLRKTVGTDGYPPEVRFAMGLLGGGSGLASLGGLLFIIVMVRAWRRRKSHPC